MPSDAAYSIADLARVTGLNVRTIRYYIAQGLIPASGESGPGAHYGQGHLDRLRLTKRLQAQHLPLSEIRAQLSALGDDEIATLLAGAEGVSETPRSSALDYVRGLLEPRPPAGGGLAARMQVAPPSAPVAASGPAPAPAPTPVLRQPGPLHPARLLMRREAPPAGPAPEQPALAETDEAYAETPAPAPPAPPERSQWERLSLGPNIELHVRRPLSRLEQRRVDRFITIARQVLHDDPA
jgi:DNA-binding transcriptional MerR regulator